MLIIPYLGGDEELGATPLHGENAGLHSVSDSPRHIEALPGHPPPTPLTTQIPLPKRGNLHVTDLADECCQPTAHQVLVLVDGCCIDVAVADCERIVC